MDKYTLHSDTLFEWYSSVCPCEFWDSTFNQTITIYLKITACSLLIIFKFIRRCVVKATFINNTQTNQQFFFGNTWVNTGISTRFFFSFYIVVLHFSCVYPLLYRVLTMKPAPCNLAYAVAVLALWPPWELTSADICFTFWCDTK
jgi:hypothetical protein